MPVYVDMIMAHVNSREAIESSDGFKEAKQSGLIFLEHVTDDDVYLALFKPNRGPFCCSDLPLADTDYLSPAVDDEGRLTIEGSWIPDRAGLIRIGQAVWWLVTGIDADCVATLKKSFDAGFLNEKRTAELLKLERQSDDPLSTTRLSKDEEDEIEAIIDRVWFDGCCSTLRDVVATFELLHTLCQSDISWSTDDTFALCLDPFDWMEAFERLDLELKFLDENLRKIADDCGGEFHSNLLVGYDAVVDEFAGGCEAPSLSVNIGGEACVATLHEDDGWAWDGPFWVG